MYLTPSQNYTAGSHQSVANRATQAAKQFSKQQATNGPTHKQVKGIGTSPGNSLNKKISYDQGGSKVQVSVPAKRSP